MVIEANEETLIGLADLESRLQVGGSDSCHYQEHLSARHWLVFPQHTTTQIEHYPHVIKWNQVSGRASDVSKSFTTAKIKEIRNKTALTWAGIPLWFVVVEQKKKQMFTYSS